MSEAGPRISVALCTYNGARFLREQLESIAAQTLLPVELVICDDGSTDDTLVMLETFQASASFHVLIHRNTQTLGVTQNYAQAIERCSGAYIALADQDDVWAPEKLERLSRPLESDTAAGFAFSDARLIDESGRDLGGKSLLARRFTLDSINRAFTSGDPLDLMLKRDFIYGTTLVFRAVHRDLILPIPANWSHDTWIANILTLHGIDGIPVLEPLVRYRQHAVQASGGTSNPKRVAYGTRVAAYEHLRQRIAGSSATPRVGALRRIDDKLMYLRAMASMASASAAAKIRIAAGEVASGRWLRYTPRTFLVDKRIDPSALRQRLQA